MSREDASLYRPYRPSLVRLLNWLGAGLERGGLTTVRLSEDAVLEAAVRRSGLQEFGDERFRDGLRVLVDAFDREAELNSLGRFMVREILTMLLVARLELEADYRRYPAMASIPIQRPVFIAGLFRTGTTLLHELLALHPRLRALKLWEMRLPSPPPVAGEKPGDDRIDRIARSIVQANRLAPAMSVIHPLKADAPDECNWLMMYDFRSIFFEMMAHIPTYRSWLERQDMVPTYRYYRRLLQHFQLYSAERRLLLKAPAHLFSLDALLEVFPDACVIQTHRSPAESLPSLCSLTAVSSGMFSDHVDKGRLGAHWLERVAAGLERAREARRTATSARFVDVQYADLVKDAPGTVRRICEACDLGFPEGLEADIRRYLAVQSGNVRGAHRYSLQEFQLDPERVQQRLEVG